MNKLLQRLTPKKAGWQTSAALLFVVAGFIVIGVAWNGAAGVDFAQGQIPYLLSGGAMGLGLIAVGVALMIFEAARRSRVHLDSRLDSIIEALQDVRAAAPAPSENGHRKTEGLVIIGATSFHLPECRLVTGKADQVAVTTEEAITRGLNACRVCMPDLATDRA